MFFVVALVNGSSSTFQVSRPRFLRHPEFRVVKGNLGNLSYLALNVDEDGSLDVFTDCPALRTIDLCLEMNIPWQQIQKMFVGVDPGLQMSFLRLISRCSSLDSLDLRLIDGKASGADVVERHISTNIETPVAVSLLLQHSSVVCHKFLFQQLEFPKLSSLQISPLLYYHSHQHLDIAPLLDQPTRSPSRITSLSLKHVRLSYEQRLRLLELMPGLETLGIAETYESGPIAQYKVQTNSICTPRFLAGPSPSPALIPNLRKLILSVHRHNLDLDKLYEVAHPRCSDAADSTSDRWNHLRSLELIFYPEGNPGTGVSWEEQISQEHGGRD
ncbi:hypothetical protein E1B28_010764 [Marasmius oreades]|uniref:Uncharacterized protein n=1 Tax=Marasmius oreades TaxID=181124 RepID=A0A9P7RSR6_9AGAR|nr:uncharacterized protein E1B28_010764 [Marasmius oreades]KAG7089054.1 hypothetical protein E1B28_010764 [Marasmius oreades]